MKPTNDGAAIIGREAMLALRSLFVAAVGVIAIWIAGFVFTPQKTKIISDELCRKFDMPSLITCRSETVTNLNRRESELRRISKRLESAGASLETKNAAARKLVSENRQLLAQNHIYRTQGRKMLRTAPSNAPIRFIGTDYPDAEALREQVKLLFDEGQRLETVLARSETLSSNLKTVRSNIIAQRSAVSRALESIPSLIELAEAEDDKRHLDEYLTSLNDTVSGARRGGQIADRLLRSTERLVVDAARPARNDADFLKWLNSSDQ